MIPDMPPPVQPKVVGPDGLEAGDEDIDPKATIAEYLYSILYMPHSMRMVCLTNLCCWMAHVCYSLYFTDFVGEAVFGGDPKVWSTLLHIAWHQNNVEFMVISKNDYSNRLIICRMVISREWLQKDGHDRKIQGWIHM